jgi:response regulator RpfG family c-di-GMP phosphodiesterase
MSEVNNKKRVILCVDDEKIILDSLESELSQKLPNNYIIELAESGEEALEIIDEVLEDGLELALIISDYIMPGMKGDEVLIQSHQKVQDALKIMLTGQADANAVGNVINQAKLYQYISKPWEKEDLWLTVSAAIENYEQHKSILAILDEKKDAQKKIIATRKQMFEVHNSKLKEQQGSLEALQIEVASLKVEKETIIDSYKKVDENYKKTKLQLNACQAKLKHFQDDTAFLNVLKREIERSIEYDRTFSVLCFGIDTFDILVNKWQDKQTENRLLTLVEQYIKEILPSYCKVEKISGGRFKVLYIEMGSMGLKLAIENLLKKLSSKIGRFGDDLITISCSAVFFDNMKFSHQVQTIDEIAAQVDRDSENILNELRLSSNRGSIKTK